jgi:hypothetical protein
MAEQGYTPNLPIVLVPGFASSGLRVVESSHKPWVNDRVWLSLNKIMSQNARKRLDVGRSKKCYDTIDFANKVRACVILSHFFIYLFNYFINWSMVWFVGLLYFRICGSSTFVCLRRIVAATRGTSR